MPYDLTLEKAIEAFLEKDPAAMARAAGCAYSPEKGVIETAYMARPYSINCADGQTLPLGHDRPLRQDAHILVLHNLVAATGRQLTGKLVSFRELPRGGSGYYPAFKKRAIDPLTKTFGTDPGRMLRALGPLSCEQAAHGDAALLIRVLPRLPVIYAVWAGDDELSPSGTVLFDSSACDYLPTEDIAVAAGSGAYEIIKAASI